MTEKINFNEMIDTLDDKEYIRAKLDYLLIANHVRFRVILSFILLSISLISIFFYRILAGFVVLFLAVFLLVSSIKNTERKQNELFNKYFEIKKKRGKR